MSSTIFYYLQLIYSYFKGKTFYILKYLKVLLVDINILFLKLFMREFLLFDK